MFKRAAFFMCEPLNHAIVCPQLTNEILLDADKFAFSPGSPAYVSSFPLDFLSGCGPLLPDRLQSIETPV